MLVFNKWLYKVYCSLQMYMQHQSLLSCNQVETRNNTCTSGTHVIQVPFDYCNIICLAMRPLQQNFIHNIKMTVTFDDKMPHLYNKQLGRVGGGYWAKGKGRGFPYIMAFIEMCCCSGTVGFSSSVIGTRGVWNSVSVMGIPLETKYRIRVFGLLS